MDGSLIDQKMGMGAAPRAVRKKEEISDLSGDIQVMNRFNDNLLQPNSSLKTLEKLESVDIQSDFMPVRLFEAHSSS